MRIKKANERAQSQYAHGVNDSNGERWSVWSSVTKRIFVALTAIILAAWTSFPTELNPGASKHSAKPCIVFVDDVSNPVELKQHGIEAADPETLAQIFDSISAKSIAATLIYMPVRQQASLGVPVVIDVPAFNEDPPTPPERGLPLPDLQKAWVAFRKAKQSYEERLHRFETMRSDAKDKFVAKALDALTAAEVEISALRRTRQGYRASDIEGTILAAVATVTTMRPAGTLFVLNTDMMDEPSHRRPRTTPFSEQELPPNLIRGLVLVNTSYKPDRAPIISKTIIAKHHVQSMRAAAELGANLLVALK
jgi:hypothetical protein